MNSRLLLRFGVLIGVVLGLWMCSKEPDVVPPKAQEPLYSVAKARAYYDGTNCTTRTMAEPGPLTPGDYSLDWDQAEVSLDSLLSSVDVPIEMQYRYYRYLQPEPDSVELVPIYSKLVVVKEHPTLLEGCYIRYMMPARSMISAYPDFDYDALLNSHPKTDFSGVSVYTDLNGWPMCVAYYYEGDLLFDAFLFDKDHTLEENIARLSDLLGDLTVARCSQARTRAQQESPVLDGGKIEDVIILPEWELHLRNLLSEISITNPDLDNCPKPTTDDGGNGGGGSGSSSGSSGDSENSSSEHNENIKFEDEETKEIIEPLLDSISQDCMGKTLLDALDGVTIEIHPYSFFLTFDLYNYETNTIHLEAQRTGGYLNFILLEELIHKYQHQQGYKTKSIEKEIEAKVGWMLFLYRLHNQNLHNNIQNAAIELAYMNSDANQGIVRLADMLVFGYDVTGAEFTEAYEVAVATLRSNPTYNTTNYPSSNDQSLMNLQNILNLMYNCTSFYEN